LDSSRSAGEAEIRIATSGQSNHASASNDDNGALSFQVALQHLSHVC